MQALNRVFLPLELDLSAAVSHHCGDIRMHGVFGTLVPLLGDRTIKRHLLVSLVVWDV